MNREIKFRAWNEPSKKMHTYISPWRWDFVIDLGMHKCIENNGDGVLGSGGTEAKFEVPGLAYTHLMQFTGLTADGVDVYEGDIIDFMDGTPLVAVEWNDDLCSWQHSDGTLLNDGYQYGRIRRVIGNIYENPELIS